VLKGGTAPEKGTVPEANKEQQQGNNREHSLHHDANNDDALSCSFKEDQYQVVPASGSTKDKGYGYGASTASHQVELAAINPANDYIPPDMIALLVTDTGCHSPSYVYRLIAEYFASEDHLLD
jgi:translation initiation factor 2B subunit (eIF-2B alpha/beta/delta family)